jgi:hypothetical protein
MKRAAIGVLLTLTLAGCSDEDSGTNVSGAGWVEIGSEPQGARIFVDGKDRHKLTPDTIRGLSGRHDVSAFIDSAGARYGFMINLDVQPDSIIRFNGPLMLSRCSNTCGALKTHTPNRIFFSRSAAGPLLYTDGSGTGLRWPATTSNSYASIGAPLFAGIMLGADTVSLGIYDLTYYAGRPFPQVQVATNLFTLRQSYWLLPPMLQTTTVRGIEITENVVASPNVDDVLVVKLVFRNITNKAAYRAADPLVPPNGFTFDRVYVGFGLDADIGTSTDDLFSYDPDLNAIFMYDAAFQESTFNGAANTQPGLVGLRILDAPGAARRVLNGWPSTVAGVTGDWKAGLVTERLGHSMLSGRLAFAPDHADDTIGHMPGSNPADYRISVSAGPVTLAPGDSTFLTVAIALADPAAGTFTSGTIVTSGDPKTVDRTIMKVAATLRQRLLAAEALR